MFKVFSSMGAIAFIAVMLLFGHEAHTQQTAPALIQQLGSVVSITGDHSHCSGWVKAGTQEVVTAAHCTDGDNTEILDVDFGDGKAHPFHIKKKGDVTFVKGPDLMVLYTNDRTINWPPGFAVCPFSPFYGEELVMMGGPLNRAKSVSFGRVGNPSVSLEDLTSGAKYSRNLIEYDGQLLPGNSGGPAIDVLYQCVIGSAELIQSADPLAGASYGLPFLTPISDLKVIE